jgi:MFS superfamily sulfate permease-like transporter
MKNLFSTWKSDLPSGLVVFLVALPLCLGIGLASTSIDGIEGLPSLFAGIIPGIIGGIIVGALSGSKLGVSGPAAGLITIVTAGIITLGSYEGFLIAVILSGVIQLIAGYLKAGVIGNYFPTSVIKGMLAAIGITLILKQIPHAVGYDADFMGDNDFNQMDGENTFSEIEQAMGALQPGAVVIALVSIALLILLERKFFKKMNLFNFLPGALIVVFVGIFLNILFSTIWPAGNLGNEHLVGLPVASNITEFFSFFASPDFSFLLNPNVYAIALTLALVGSLETLLSVEATDKLDPDKYHTPTNRELKAQGLGNVISGALGGLPITQVIVRSSANINTGAKSRLSTIFHGLLLFICVAFIPTLLNLIPLASLAAILILIGYKLARLELFKQMYKNGLQHLIPFAGTIIGVLLTNLLVGIGIGLALAIFYILKNNFSDNFSWVESSAHGQKKSMEMILTEHVSFLNKGGIKAALENVQTGTTVTINGWMCKSIHLDVVEYLKEFIEHTAPQKDIEVHIKHLTDFKDC